MSIHSSAFRLVPPTALAGLFPDHSNPRLLLPVLKPQAVPLSVLPPHPPSSLIPFAPCHPHHSMARPRSGYWAVGTMLLLTVLVGVFLFMGAQYEFVRAAEEAAEAAAEAAKAAGGTAAGWVAGPRGFCTWRYGMAARDAAMHPLAHPLPPSVPASGLACTVPLTHNQPPRRAQAEVSPSPARFWHPTLLSQRIPAPALSTGTPSPASSP